MQTTWGIVALISFSVILVPRLLAGEIQSGLNVGDVPPPLNLSETVQGPSRDEIKWDKLKGKVVVLEFWNTGCRPCVEAIPHWNELVDGFKGKPVVFISISDDNADYLKNFLKRKPIKGWVVLDGPFNPTQTAFGLDGWPYTIVVDATGKIAAITNPELFKSVNLDEVLAGKPCSALVLKPQHVISTNAVSASLQAPEKIIISMQGPFPMPKHGGWDYRGWTRSNPFPDFEAKRAYLADALPEFFGISPKLISGMEWLPKGLYDISATAPSNQLPELKRQFVEKLKTTLGIEIRVIKQSVEVYALTVVSTNAPGRKQVQVSGGGGGKAGGFGGFYVNGCQMDSTASYLESFLDHPVINQTGLGGLWALDVKWPLSYWELTLWDLELPSPADTPKVIRSVREQLGLGLVQTNQVMDVLEIIETRN